MLSLIFCFRTVKYCHSVLAVKKMSGKLGFAACEKPNPTKNPRRIDLSFYIISESLVPFTLVMKKRLFYKTGDLISEGML